VKNLKITGLNLAFSYTSYCKFVYMKKYIVIILVVTGCIATGTIKAQDLPDSTGLPGDNFSLQGALELFKKSTSPEEFEKLLNKEENSVNNLDLNGDGDIDYIKVIDKTESKAHALILQVAVSEKENQDIAVIEIEKTGDQNAIVQIVGDEEIYGRQTIAEPFEEGDEQAYNTNNFKGPHFNDEAARVIVNVWFWPSVQFMYAPVYRPWVSPWGWRRYPAYWRPWRPVYWNVYRPRIVHYHRYYRVVPTHRVVYAHRVYAPARVSSVTVQTRYHAPVNNYRVAKTTSRKTVTGPRGNNYSVTKKTTTVQGPHGGQVKRTDYKVRRRRN
jgi:hypothetical protein